MKCQRPLAITAVFLSTALIVSSCGPDPNQEHVIQVPNGFQVDTLYSPSLNAQGSWISLTTDNQGRLIASSEKGKLFRLTPPPIGGSLSETVVEEIDADIGHAQGLLWAFNSLYVVVSTFDGIADHNTGLYRLRDYDGDDAFETIELIVGFNVEAPEHGPHGIVLGPDGRYIYLVAGNHTDLPKSFESRVTTSTREDLLFPAIRDPRGHAANRMPPGGWIARTDSVGSHWDVIAVGLRNPYDLVFSAGGDLFTFDGDMEWDFGLPWYRPIRFCFVPNKAEFGWRTGSGKWPEGYLDGVAPVLNIGQGSPTGLVSIEGGRFPPDFQNDILLFDWSYGTIYQLDLRRAGAGYTATAKPFLSGTPLPLTDGVIAEDGALYFVTGGRSLTSYVFRTYYKEKGKAIPVSQKPPAALLRENLEQWQKPGVDVDSLIPFLGHPDRLVRYAARVALEFQPVGDWQSIVLRQSDPLSVTSGLVALARTGDRQILPEALSALVKIDVGQLEPDAQLDVLRTYSLLFSRFGKPAPNDRELATAHLSGLFPTGNDVVDRELCRLLVFLDDPTIVGRAISLLKNADVVEDLQHDAVSQQVTDVTEYAGQLNEMLEASVMAQSVSYAMSLSYATAGWSENLRQQYFDWFEQSMQYTGGPSYRGYLDLMRGTALSKLPAEIRQRFLTNPGLAMGTIPQAKGPGRPWSIIETRAAWNAGKDEKRDFSQGRVMYQAALCESCHSIRGVGGNVGPDLTKAWSRFSEADLVKAIVTPSAFIPERYAATRVVLMDSTRVMGSVVAEDSLSLLLSRNLFHPADTIRVSKSEIVSRTHSSVSPMPPGLLNSLNEEELLDLLAFIRAEGDPEHASYN